MKNIETVSTQVFFDAIANDLKGAHSMSKKDDIVVHIITGPDDTVIIPIKDIFEDLDGDDVVFWLIRIGLFSLIPFLVPNHEMAKIIRRLPPKNF